jgi:hypothetical protein
VIDKKLKYKDQKLTKAQQKKTKPANQGGGPNYLGKQKTVTVPKKWLSSPDHVVAELAYITPREQKILLDADLYGSLKGQPNKGPDGIMSLQGDMGKTGGGGRGGSGGGSGNNNSPGTTQSGKNANTGGGNNNRTSPMQDAQQERKSKEVGFDQNDRSNPYSEASKTAIDNFNQDIADRSTTNNTTSELTNPLAPEKKGGFFNTGFGWSDLGMAALYAFNPVLGAKVGKLKTAYNTAKLIGDTTGLYNAKSMKDNLLSQFSNFKGGPTDSNSENQWWASTLTGDNGNDNNRGGETISEPTLSPGIEGTRSPIRKWN